MNIYNKLSSRGCAPQSFILDNETSGELLNAFQNNKVQYQLVPPDNHRRNAAERAIRTWKKHFIAGLCSTDPSFPMAEWDRLVKQGEITLNLLRNSRVNPRLSAWAYLFGQFDFNATPMAPPGTKVIIHSKPNTRASWDPRGMVGFYTGPALQHYRCCTCFVLKTRAERVTDTLTFIPAKIPIPELDATAHLHQAVDDILTIIKNPHNNLPFLQAGDPTHNAIRLVSEILHRSTAPSSNLYDTVHHPQTPSAEKTSTPHLPQMTASPRVEPTTITQSSPRVATLHHPTALPRVETDTTLTPPSASFTPATKPTLLPSMAHIAPHTTINHFHSSHADMFLYPSMNHIYNDTTGKRETIDSLRASVNGSVWERALSNEWGRLADGNKYNVWATNTIEFIFRHEVPANRDVTYASFVCDHRPLKSEPWRVCIVVGGDRLTYADDPGSPAASLVEIKIMINSVISHAHKGARFMSLDLKDFFLATPMLRPEYMKVPIKYFPQDIIEKYSLDKKVDANGFVYVQINKGMYGLKQAAVLAYQHLIDNLQKDGYTPIEHTDSYWRHATLPTVFCLCVTSPTPTTSTFASPVASTKLRCPRPIRHRTGFIPGAR